jgi:pimeloyl-ACP methyl ester carboxylesterase
LEGPYVLCGYSFGGLVAFETARQLYERDRASTLLFLVEPSLPAPFRKGSLSRIVHRLRELPSVAPSRRTAHLRAKAKACLQHVKRWTRQIYCGARLQFGLSVPVGMRWSYVEDQYRRAATRYVPRPFPGKLVLVNRKGYGPDYVEPWAGLATGGFSLHEMSTPDHVDFVQRERVISEWADLLRRHLKSPAGLPGCGPESLIP